MTVEVTRSPEGLRIARLDLFFVELLRQVPVSADPMENDAARQRLYPPVDPGDAKANEEWGAYIHPELKDIFSAAGDVVRDDLENFEQLDETQENWAFEIPVAHFDQWLNVLNQARLALAARFELQEEELSMNGPATIETVRDLSLFQVQFYGFLQECLLQDLGEA